MKKHKSIITLALSMLLAGFALIPPGKAAQTEGYGDCPLLGKPATAQIQPAVAGQLTVIINLPALGQFNGDTPETIRDGYEFCMAVNIAHTL